MNRLQRLWRKVRHWPYDPPSDHQNCPDCPRCKELSERLLQDVIEVRRPAVPQYLCMATSPPEVGEVPVLCTLPLYHDEDMHVAAASNRLLAVWPVLPD